MSKSLDKINVRFSDAQQERSRKTLDDLFDAASTIVESGDPGQFDARTLSKVSGYSLGSLVKRLGKIENVFLYVITLQRSRELQKIAQELGRLEPDVDPRRFVETLADLAFKRIEKVNPSVIRYYEKRALARADDLAAVYSYTEEIVDPLLQLIEANQAGKFRNLDRNEASYICRAMFLFIERPYVERNPIAGTDIHRRMVVENIARLLAANH